MGDFNYIHYLSVEHLEVDLLIGLSVYNGINV